MTTDSSPTTRALTGELAVVNGEAWCTDSNGKWHSLGPIGPRKAPPARRPKDQYVLIGPDGRIRSGCRNSEKTRWTTFLGKMPEAELELKIADARLRGYRVEKL